MKWQRQYWGGMQFQQMWFLTTSLEISGASPIGNHLDTATVVVDGDRIYVVHDGSRTNWYETDIYTQMGIVCLDTLGSVVYEKAITFDQAFLGSTDFMAFQNQGEENRNKMVFPHPTETNHLLVYIPMMNNQNTEANLRYYLMHLDENGDIVTLTTLGLSTSDTWAPATYGDDLQTPNIAVASNGDVWYHHNAATTRGYVACLDYSGSYTSLVYSGQIDAFDDGTETEVPGLTQNELDSLSVILSDGETFVTMAPGHTYDSPTVIASINSSGTVAAIDFIHDTGGSGGDEYYFLENMAAGSGGVFYTLVQAVTQGDSGSPLRFVLAQWDSDLTQNWAIEFDELKESAGSSTPLNVSVLKESPDGQYLYMAGFSSAGDLYGLTINVTNGSVITDWRIISGGTTGSEDVILSSMDVGSDFIVLGGFYRDSTHDEPGYAVAKIPQRLFDQMFLSSAARGLSCGIFRKLPWTSPPYTTASVTLTTNTLVTTKSTWTPSPASAISEGFIDGSRDLPGTVEYVRTYATATYWSGH